MNPNTSPITPSKANTRRQPEGSHSTSAHGAGDVDDFVSVDQPQKATTSQTSRRHPLNARGVDQLTQASRNTLSSGAPTSRPHSYPPPASPGPSPDRLPGNYPPAPARLPNDQSPHAAASPSSGSRKGWPGLPGSWGARLPGLTGARDNTPAPPIGVRDATPAAVSPSALLGKVAQLASPPRSWGFSKGRRSDSVTAFNQAPERGESSTGGRRHSPARIPSETAATCPRPPTPPNDATRVGGVGAKRDRGYGSFEDTEAWSAALSHLATMGSTARWASSPALQTGDDDASPLAAPIAQSQPQEPTTSATQIPLGDFEGPTHPTYTLDRDERGNLTFGVARADDEVASISDSDPDAHKSYGVDSIHSSDESVVQREGIDEGWEAVADEVAEEAVVDSEWVGGASAVVAARGRAAKAGGTGGYGGAKEGSGKLGGRAGGSLGRESRRSG